MGSKLALLAAVELTISLIGRHASADNASKARDLFKKGVAEYTAKNYDEAAASLAASYALDPTPQALFAQAQAERIGGHCHEAIVHYRYLLETANDLPTIKAVQTNLAACPKEPTTVGVEPTVEAAPQKVEPAPPQVVTRTLVREVPRSDRLSTVLFAGGMLGLGAGVGLYIASNGALDDADHARTLDDHDKFSDRAKLERTLAYGVGGVGAALITVAVVRWARGGISSSSTAEVAVVPTSSGGMLSLSSPW
ncbi:hypothetical protein BH11MYX3_BH11MYX3_25440 [soil metagenome]